MSSSDRDLLASFQHSGDPACLDQLVRNHLGRVRSLIYPMVCSHSIADDLTQETFLRALSALSRFENRCEFSTWIYQIAMNTCRDYFRKKTCRGSMSSLDTASLPELPESKLEAPWRRIEIDEVSAEVQSALLELPENLRAAITLVSMHGMTAAQAAEIEQCSLATMYWRIHQSKKKLMQRLGKLL